MVSTISFMIVHLFFITLSINVYTTQANSEQTSFTAASQLTFRDILTNHDRTTETPNRLYKELLVLGFMTPWNRRGEQVAQTESSRGKLDIVSPVTWQMHPEGLKGGNDFHKSLYTNLTNQGTKIYPRVLFEAQSWRLTDFERHAADPRVLADQIVQMCKREAYHGVVLEIWQTLLYVNAFRSKKRPMFDLLSQLGETIQQNALHAILVLPPYSKSTAEASGITSHNFAQLQHAYSRFVIMTYDYSRPGSSPGPLAPVHWVRDVGVFFVHDCQLQSRVLLGLNFYGLDFATADRRVLDRHIVGHEFIDLLRRHEPDIVWLNALAEHGFSYVDGPVQHVVFFPSRFSIAARVALAKEIGAGGVAVWELGQGLDHFFEEF